VPQKPESKVVTCQSMCVQSPLMHHPGPWSTGVRSYVRERRRQIAAGPAESSSSVFDLLLQLRGHIVHRTSTQPGQGRLVPLHPSCRIAQVARRQALSRLRRAARNGVTTWRLTNAAINRQQDHQGIAPVVTDRIAEDDECGNLLSGAETAIDLINDQCCRGRV
jgi:hypothetical protein